MTEIIRLTLTLGVLYGVYTETGIWTALALFLVSITLELQSITLRRQHERSN